MAELMKHRDAADTKRYRMLAISYAEFNEKYNQRDITARRNMHELINSDANKVIKVFSTLFAGRHISDKLYAQLLDLIEE